MKPTVYGVGIKGSSSCVKNKKEYNIWRSILARCYVKTNKDYNRYGAIGVTVSDRWKLFDNFLEDISKVKGYDRDLFYKNKINLDKDISGKKIYSKEDCIFVSCSENQRHRNNNLSFYVIYNDFSYEKFTNTSDFIEKHNECTQDGISACVYGKNSTHKGFVFIKEEDFNKNNIKDLYFKKIQPRKRIKYPFIIEYNEKQYIINNSFDLKCFEKDTNIKARKIRDIIQGRIKSYTGFKIIK